MKILLTIIILMSNLYAGGDDRQGKITFLSTKSKTTIFKFQQSNKNIDPLIGSCYQITIELNYSYVPWYTWLPFIQSSHPTVKQNNKAIEIIKKAYEDKKSIYFGYMGSGFKITNKKCYFKSKGLLLFDSHSILSFYGPV